LRYPEHIAKFAESVLLASYTGGSPSNLGLILEHIINFTEVKRISNYLY